MLWKAVPGSRTCICESPLAELGMCPRRDMVRIVVDDRRPQHVVAIVAVCTASERCDGDLLL